MSSMFFWDDDPFEINLKSGEKIVVKGFKMELKVFTTHVKVGHGCCHVMRIRIFGNSILLVGLNIQLSGYGRQSEAGDVFSREDPVGHS